MSLEAHIATIARKREQIKQRIAEEMAHPNPDFTLITTLKKQNLYLKQEMQHYFRQMKTSATAS